MDFENPNEIVKYEDALCKMDWEKVVENMMKNNPSIMRYTNAVSFLSTLPVLRLLLFKAQECKDIWKSSWSCRVGIYWIALTEYSQMITHMPGL